MSKLELRNCFEMPADREYIINDLNKIGVYYKGYVYTYSYLNDNPVPFPLRKHITEWCTHWIPLAELCQDREDEYSSLIENIEYKEA